MNFRLFRFFKNSGLKSQASGKNKKASLQGLWRSGKSVELTHGDPGAQWRGACSNERVQAVANLMGAKLPASACFYSVWARHIGLDLGLLKLVLFAFADTLQGSGENATAKRLGEFLDARYKDVFDCRDIFESGRSLVKSLRRWKIYDSFMAQVGDQCDYLAAGLEHKAQLEPGYDSAFSSAKTERSSSLPVQGPRAPGFHLPASSRVRERWISSFFWISCESRTPTDPQHSTVVVRQGVRSSESFL